jgi:hypothetical protein
MADVVGNHAASHPRPIAELNASGYASRYVLISKDNILYLQISAPLAQYAQGALT